MMQEVIPVICLSPSTAVPVWTTIDNCFKLCHFFKSKMLYSEEYTTSAESSHVQRESSKEIKVVRLIDPYADEPLAHSRNNGENLKEDLDGLSPAVYSARFNRGVSVNG